MAYFKLEVSYFNSFWLKKTIYTGTPGSDNAGVPYTYGDFATPQQYRGGIASNFPGLPFVPSAPTGTSWPTFPSGCGSEPTCLFLELLAMMK